MKGSAPSLQIYGAGRVGLAIARLARRRGVPVAGLWNPRPVKPERLRLAEGLPLSVDDSPPVAAADLWLIAVPDDAIAETDRRLAEMVRPGSTSGPSAAAHCAGAHPGRLLEALAGAGVACGSWHPAMTFRGAADDADALAGAVVAVEGEPAARRVLDRFGEALGVKQVAVAAENKADYHAALVLAANGRVALDLAALRLLRSAGLEERAARTLLAPLVARVEANLRVAFPEEALTGPVARGDVGTVRRQLEVLADRPPLLALYRALGAVIVETVPPSVLGEGHREVAKLMREENPW